MTTEAASGGQSDIRATNMALAHAFIDAINRWDFDALRDMLAEDFVFTIPFVPEGFPERIDGRDTWIGFVQEWSQQLDGSENLHDVTGDTMASDPGEVIVFYSSDMTMKETKHSYRNRYVGRLVIRDGKVNRFDEYLDSIPLLVAAGGDVTMPPAATGA